jgi:hypothetical protein
MDEISIFGKGGRLHSAVSRSRTQDREVEAKLLLRNSRIDALTSPLGSYWDLDYFRRDVLSIVHGVLCHELFWYHSLLRRLCFYPHCQFCRIRGLYLLEWH